MQKSRLLRQIVLPEERHMAMPQPERNEQSLS
jgi:hypothetical protein